ncbi:MAG: ATPase, T2SS/T4P/T4SS family [Fimbriimonas sp.]|nr:ATPase, T2SS/T4P/T4SS family [Fimbriimonas sp.]
MKLTEFFEIAIRQHASDIHLSTGEIPRIRIDGVLTALDLPRLEGTAMNELLTSYLSPESVIRVASGKAVERSVVHDGMTFTGIAFRGGDDRLAVTFRVLAKAVPELKYISEGADSFWREIMKLPNGLVIVAGPVNSGKWTTVCSLIEEINATIAARLFVIEAHPNYRFESKQGLVTQFHVGEDCESYGAAMEIAHQADLDVLAIDDVSSTEALRQALVLAETGHLVLANLHATSIPEAIDRLANSLDLDPMTARMRLARNLKAVSVQRLIPRNDRPGRIAVYEWIRVTPPVKQAIIAEDSAGLNRLQASDPECRSLEQALDDLVQSDTISRDAAMSHQSVIE